MNAVICVLSTYMLSSCMYKNCTFGSHCLISLRCINGSVIISYNIKIYIYTLRIHKYNNIDINTLYSFRMYKHITGFT